MLRGDEPGVLTGAWTSRSCWKTCTMAVLGVMATDLRCPSVMRTYRRGANTLPHPKHRVVSRVFATGWVRQALAGLANRFTSPMLRTYGSLYEKIIGLQTWCSRPQIQRVCFCLCAGCADSVQLMRPLTYLRLLGGTRTTDTVVSRPTEALTFRSRMPPIPSRCH